NGVLVTVNNSSVTVNEGSPAANTGTFSDIGSTVTSISASVGTVTPGAPGTANGPWNWSYTPTDGPIQSQTVTITATDALGRTGTVTFPLTVNNVAPTATLSNNVVITYGQTATVSFSNQFDPSSVDTAAGFHSWFATTAFGASDPFTASNNYAGGST